MVNLQNIHSDFRSYQQLINLYDRYKEDSFNDVPVNLVKWFSANMCSALGGILDLLADNLNEIHLDASSGIETILSKNDFLSFYGYERLKDYHRTTIRYLKLRPSDGKYFSSYVRDELLNRAELPDMSQLVKNKMTEAIYEILVNAQIHSGSNFIYTCGQFFPARNSIDFMITDVGIGFKKKVNDRFNASLSSVQAIRWGTGDRNTTKTDISGGIGLALLKEFVDMNGGKMQIVSDDGFFQYEHGKEWTKFFDGKFPGSIVSLSFKTDDASTYVMKEEIDNDDIF